MTQPPDTRYSLIARLADMDDQEAWREFADIYDPFIYRQGRRFGLQHSDARELVQEVLISVTKAIRRFEVDSTRGRFRTWLYAVGRNVSLQYLAKLKANVRASGNSEVMSALASIPASEPHDSDEIRRELCRHVFLWVAQRVRKEFHATSWKAFWQTAVENHAAQTVAKNLGLSLGAVYIARSRIMARLREGAQEITLEDFPDALDILLKVNAMATTELGAD